MCEEDLVTPANTEGEDSSDITEDSTISNEEESEPLDVEDNQEESEPVDVEDNQE